MKNPPLNLTVRVDCHIVCETTVPTAMLLVLRPRNDGNQRVGQQQLTFNPPLSSYQFEDPHGNLTDRAVLQPGENIIHHDALVDVSSLPDNHEPPGPPTPVYQLPPDTLRYTLPSRYLCFFTFTSCAPREAWCLLQGERRCRVRNSQPPVPSVGVMKEQRCERHNVSVDREPCGP